MQLIEKVQNTDALEYKFSVLHIYMLCVDRRKRAKQKHNKNWTQKIYRVTFVQKQLSYTNNNTATTDKYRRARAEISSESSWNRKRKRNNFIYECTCAFSIVVVAVVSAFAFVFNSQCGIVYISNATGANGGEQATRKYTHMQNNTYWITINVWDGFRICCCWKRASICLNDSNINGEYWISLGSVTLCVYRYNALKYWKEDNRNGTLVSNHDN